MSSCDVDKRDIERYLDGELPEAMRPPVEAALESCDDCLAYAEEPSRLGEALRADIADAVMRAPLDGLWDRIEPELGREAQRVKRPSLGGRLRAWWATQRLELVLGACATAAAVALLVWIAGGPTEQTPAAVDEAPAIAAPEDNTLQVESYEVDEGTVVIDVDPEDPTAPAIVWHFVDDEEDRI